MSRCDNRRGQRRGAGNRSNRRRGSSSIGCPPATPVRVRGWEYDPDTPIEPLWDEIPRANLQASAGERIILRVAYKDMDRRRWRDPVGDWEELRDEGPYQLRFSATNALFANDDRRACIDGLVSGNVDLIIDGDWTGTPPVTVQLKVVDLATPKSGRDTGSTKDADYTFEWTIKPRTRPHPTSMACDSSNYGSDKEAPEAYDYIMNPVIDPPGRPSYKGQSVLEQFGPITANFNMSDIKDEYLARLTNKGLNTPNQVAQFLCSGGQHGTFVIDETDTIYDIHGGFACPIKPFKEASLKSGIGYTLPQTYSCAGTVIGRYTIRRTYRDGQIFINKSGP